MTPVSGKIIEANEILAEKPATINKEPENGGWIAKIEVTDLAEAEELMDAEKYEEFTAE